MIGRNRRRRRWTALALLIGASAAGGCGGAPRIDVPSTLPNVTRQDFLTLRWALSRDGGVARAVGVAESSGSTSWDAVLELYGLDGREQIVSRGTTAVRPGFGPGATSFEVRLVETGRETEFRLVVARSRQSSRPSR
jgi:hypothetical protein